MDARATDVVADWQARGVLDAIWPRILQKPYAGQPPALLRWLKLHEPDVYARIGAALPAKDYIKYRLTGALSTDPSDISATGLLDLGRRDYAIELLEAYGITEIAHALPPMIASTAPAGQVTAEAARDTGLAQGTPVVGGMFDVNAGALGAGVLAPGQACMIAGTWSVARFRTASQERRSRWMGKQWTIGLSARIAPYSTTRGIRPLCYPIHTIRTAYQSGCSLSASAGMTRDCWGLHRQSRTSPANSGDHWDTNSRMNFYKYCSRKERL